MKANELMIGDWVLHHNSGCIDAMNDTAPYDEAIRIEQDDFELDECFWNRLDPIPITPEILEKNGFTNYGESWYIPNTKGCVMVGFHMYETTINISKDRVSFFKSTPCKYRSYYSNRKVYIHELQHALRLCGIEKEITV